MAEVLRRFERIPSRLKRLGWKRLLIALWRSVADTVHHWAWDVWHGVETRKQVPLKDLGVEGSSYSENPEHFITPGWNGDYSSSASWKFPERLKRLNLEWQQYTYVDLGAGKGKTLLLAAEFPFIRVIGVEFSHKLVTIAKNNVRNQRNFNFKCRDIEVIELDAAAYEFPLTPLVLYCFNSFPEPVMRVVLENLRRSFEEHPREIYMIYTHPALESLVSDYGFFTLIDSSGGVESVGGHRSYRAVLPEAQPSGQ